MKKETSAKKSKLWLWITIGVVALLAVAGVVTAILLGGGEKEEAQPKIESELYWNVDLKSVIDPATGLSIREPGQDGVYRIRFACGGKHVELPIADKKLVNRIDQLEIMGLKFDADGTVIDVYRPDEFCTMVQEKVYVQTINGNNVVLNTSAALNGMQINMTLDESMSIYDVSTRAGLCGEISQLKPMDQVTIYGPDAETPEEFFIVFRPWESDAYWRIERFFNATTKTSTREKAEDGFWYVDFAVKGQQVTLRTEMEDVINAIDGYSPNNACCGLVFNEAGDIIDCGSAALAMRGVYTANCYDITELSEDGKSFTATRIMFGSEIGKTYTAQVTDTTEIYNVNSTADMIGEVTELQMNDRIFVIADGEGKPMVIFVVNRMVDSPLYYNVSRSYSTALKRSQRKPDANGWYSIKLAVHGQEKTYRCNDVDLVNQLDGYGMAIFGLRLNGDVITKVYDAVCVTGNYSFAANNFVVGVTGPVLSTQNTAGTATNGVMIDGCEVYDVSGHGKFKGVATDVRVGDRVICYINTPGEIVYIAVINRLEEGTDMYWNVNRYYAGGDTTRAKQSYKGEPLFDGEYYHFRVIKIGSKEVTWVKTKDHEIAKRMDSYGTPTAFSLRVNSSGVVTGAYPVPAAIGGYQTLNYVHVEDYDDETGIYACQARTTGAKANFTPVEGVTKFYNFSGVYKDKAGEQTSLQIGDRISCIANQQGQVEYCLIIEREADTKVYMNKTKKWSSAKQETTREMDADGYYVFELSVDGQVKTFKTKDKEVANEIDNKNLAFGLKVNGDIIEKVYPVIAARDVNTSASGSYYDIQKINGRKLTLKRNRPGQTDTGTEVTIELSSKCKITTISPDAGDKWGTYTTLKVGDRVTGYVDNDKLVTHLYVVYAGSHEGGPYTKCEHCGEVVWWEPLMAGVANKADAHYYLTADMTVRSQYSFNQVDEDGKGFDCVLDLHGHTLTRGATDGYISSGLIGASNGNTLLITNYTENLGGLTTEECKVNAYSALITASANSVITIDKGNFDASNAAGDRVGANGGAIAVGGKLIINGGTYKGLKSIAGARVVEEKNKKGETIKNTKYGAGGVIGGWGNSEIVINGGEFFASGAEQCEDGKFRSNGGIIASNGYLTITGGTFTGAGDESVRVGSGGLVFSSGPKMSITGGTFSGGYGTGYGLNVCYQRNGGELVLGGDAYINGGLTLISGDTAKPITLRVKDQAVVDTTDAKPTAGLNYRLRNVKVYLNDEKTERITVGDTAANYSILRTCKNVQHEVVEGAKSKTIHNYSGNICKDCGDDKTVFQLWTKTDSLPTEGRWKLTGNVTVNAAVATTDELTLDLNGYNITRNVATGVTKNVNAYRFNADATILDSSNKPGTISSKFAGTATTSDSTGILTVPSGSHLTLNNVTVDGSHITSTYTGANAGAITVGGKLTVNSGTVKGFKKTDGNGTAIGSWGNSEITINGGEIFGGEATNTKTDLGQGGTIAANGNLTITGGTIHGGKAKHGGAIFMGNGDLVISGGTFHGGTVTANGAVINAGKRPVTVTGGTFYSGKASLGATIYSGADIKISGGTFKVQTCANGGAVYNVGNGTLTITGGTFTGPRDASTKTGTAKISGGLISSTGKELTITGGTFIDGGADGYGYNIYYTRNGGIMTLGGDASINGGITVRTEQPKDKNGNPTEELKPVKLTLKDQVQIDRSTALEGLTVNVRLFNVDVFLNDGTTVAFAAGAANKDISVIYNCEGAKIKGVYVGNDAKFEHDYDGNICKDCGDDKTAIKDWTDATKLPNEGNWKLATDVTISASVNMSGNLYLDLNGHTVTASTMPALRTNANKLTVDDTSAAGNGTIKATAQEGSFNYGVICVGSGGGAFVLDGGVIDGSALTNTYTGANAGTVTVLNDGGYSTATINGGKVLGMKSQGNGSAIAMRNDTSLTITGGEIVGNTVTAGVSGAGFGGAIVAPGNLTITGGKIYGGNAAAGGDNIFVNRAGAVVTISGGEIDGGFELRDFATATISGNTKINAGTNVGLKIKSGKVVDMTGLTGKVYVNADGVFTNGFATVADAQKMIDDQILVCNATGKMLSVDGTALAMVSDGSAQLWTNANDLPDEGNWKLDTDVTLDATKPLAGNLTLDLNGHTVTGNAAPVIKTEGLSLTVTDTSGKTGDQLGKITTGTLSGNFSAGIIYGNNNSIVTIENGVIDGSNITSTYSDSNAGTITVGGALTVNGGVIKGYTAANANWGGNAIGSWGGKPITINGGEIIGGSNPVKGGAISANGNLTITGGKIHGGSATNGDNIYVNNASSVVTISGGEIDGGVVLDNFAATSAISGTVKINQGTNYGLKLASGKTIDMTGLTGGEIYVDVAGTFTTAFANVDAANAVKAFVKVGKTMTGKEVSVDSLALKIADPAVTPPPATEEPATWTEWSTNNDLPDEGKYKLMTDVTLTTVHKMTGDLRLDLNGYKITRTVAVDQTADQYAIQVGGHKLTIDDLSGKPEAQLGVIQTTVADGASFTSAAGVIYANKTTTGATVVLNNGIIDGTAVKSSYATACSGTISIANDGAFVMNGGVVKGLFSTSTTTGKTGAAIGMQGSTTAVINGGKIYGNPDTGVSREGTTFAAAANTSITINGGEIYGTNATTHAGSIMTAGNLYINGGLISGGYSHNSGIICCSGNEMVITGGTIIGGTSGSNTRGKNIDKHKGTLTIGGNAVIAGGVSVRGGATLNLTGSPVINDMLQAQRKGNVWVEKNQTGTIQVNGAAQTVTAGTAYSLTYDANGVVNGLAAYAATTVNEAAALPKSGAVKLSGDVTLTEALVTEGDLYIDLNGWSITNTGSSYAINANHNLIITDTSTGATKGSIKTTTASLTAAASVINVATGKKLVLVDGIIDGHAVKNGRSDAFTGAVTLGNKAHLLMLGGEIKGQTSANTGTTGQGGGCVGAWNNAMIAIYGGKLTAFSEGLVYPSKLGAAQGSCIAANIVDVYIYGGELKGSIVANHGGTVYTKGNFYMYGGLIHGGHTTNSGNVYCEGDAVITGGTIIDGKTQGTTSNLRNGASIDKVGGTLTIGGNAVIAGGINIRAAATDATKLGKLVLKDQAVIDMTLQTIEQLYNIRLNGGSIYLNDTTGTAIATEKGTYDVNYDNAGTITGVTKK